MITFEKAYSIVLDHHVSFGIEQVPLLSATKRVLAESWYADRDFPPFDRVMMDGIAIRYSDLVAPDHKFEIKGIAAAGDTQKAIKHSFHCMEVMTGAILPKGTDTVIRYEDLAIQNGIAKVNAQIKTQSKCT